MKVSRTFDVALAYAVVTSPDIWSTIAEDGQTPAEYVPDVQTACWLTVYDDSKLVGLYILRRVNAITAEIHPMVLPKYRKQYSIAASKAVIGWFWEKAPWCRKIIGWVPTLYPNVRKHGEAIGFQIEGTNVQSYLKDGEVHDQWLLGLTRGEQDG